MKIKDLQELLKDVDPEMEVIVSISEKFEGKYAVPCILETDVIEICINEELDLTANRFAIVPHGFYSEYEHNQNLN
jgi:hypothetical protein